MTVEELGKAQVETMILGLKRAVENNNITTQTAVEQLFSMELKNGGKIITNMYQINQINPRLL